jgi:hypothetical protein
VTHIRKQIRDAVVTALEDLATTQDRVYSGRTRALKKDHGPALLVYTPLETSERSANGLPPENERTLKILIEGRVSGASAMDDDLDQIAFEVEGRMWANRDLGGLAINLAYVSSEIATEAAGESQIGGVRMEYRCTYRVLEGDPASASP